MAANTSRKPFELNQRQQRFVTLYLIEQNATKAALAAGYTAASAKSTAHLILKNPLVAEKVRLHRRAAAIRSEATVDRVVMELSRVAFADTRKLFTEDGALKRVTDLDDDTAAALAGVDTTTVMIGDGDDKYPETTKKIKMNDKVRALELLGKFLGMYIEKHEHSGNLPIVSVRDMTGKALA